MSVRAKNLENLQDITAMEKNPLEKARQLQSEAKGTIAKIRETAADFLLQELAMGLMFAQLAGDAGKRNKQEDAYRQKAAALEAYQTVLKFLPEATPTPSQRKQI